MATLTEILGENLDLDLMEMTPFEASFSTQPLTKKQSLDPSELYKADSEGIGRFEPESDRSNILEFAGQTAWSALDSALFDLPGLAAKKLAPDFYEDYLTPETAGGKVGSAIGGTVGFLAGPLRAGMRGAQLLARPIAKRMGTETLEQTIKKSVTEASTTAAGTIRKSQFTKPAAKQILEKDIGMKLKNLAHKTKWEKVSGESVAKNWIDTSKNAIDEIVNAAIKNKDITRAEANLITKAFKNNVKDRPIQDIVDIVMTRRPDKWGMLAGSLLTDATVFGLIDAALEKVHSTKDDREYDPLAPVWGLATGGAFSFLNLLPAAGKSSITSQDFMSGVRAVFKKSPYNDMNLRKLKGQAGIIGNSLKNAKEETLVKYNDITIDLSSDISINAGLRKIKGAEQKVSFLRGLLNKERVSYGRQMMKAAITEDFQSTLANWKRVLGGTAIMNGRMMMQMAQGYDLPPEEVMTSLLIGAFINRRGRPIDVNMNNTKMQTIRWNLQAHGESQMGLLDLHPTLSSSQFNNIDPLRDPALKDLREESKSLGLIAKDPDSVETRSKDGTPALSTEGKSFPLFDEFYIYLRGSAGNRYIKPRALITEAEAGRIEDMIRSKEFEGVKVDNIDVLRDLLNEATDNINISANQAIKSGVSETLNAIPGINVDTDINSGKLGTSTQFISVNQRLLNQVEAGDIKYDDNSVVSLESVTNMERKVNTLIDAADKLTFLETKKNESTEINDPKVLIDLLDKINASTATFQDIFNNGKRMNKFEIDDLQIVLPQLLVSQVNKDITTTSKVFDDVEGPKYNELMNVLRKIGVTKTVQLTGEGIRDQLVPFQKIDIIKDPDGEVTGSTDKAILETVIGILGAKSNKSLQVNNDLPRIEVHSSDIRELENFLVKQGINTDPGVLDYYRGTVVRKIWNDIARETKVSSSELNVLTELANLDNPMVQFSPMSEGGTGFSIKKIEGLGALKQGTRYPQWIAEYNKFVDDLIGKGKGFISKSDPVQIWNRTDVRVLRDITRRVDAKQQDNAMDRLVGFVKTMDPTSNTREGIIQYLEKTKNPNEFLTFLLSNGFVTIRTKKKIAKDTIQYLFHADKIDKEAVKVHEFLNKFGVDVNDIQKLETQADIDLANSLDMKYREESGAISQQRFFEKYYPDGNGASRFQDAEAQDDILKKAMYRANKANTVLRDDPYNNLVETMEVEIGGQVVSGKDLIKNKGKQGYRVAYDEAIDDARKIISSRINSRGIQILDVVKSGVRATDKNIQKSNFTDVLEDIGFPLLFGNGDIHTPVMIRDKMENTFINIFETNSSVYGDHKLPNMTSKVKTLRKQYYKELDKYIYTDKTNRDFQGVVPIFMGNAKDVLLVPKGFHSKVRDLFKKEIVDVHLADAKKLGNTDLVKRIEDMQERLNQSDLWGSAHTDAMRSIIIAKMVKGKGVDRFPEIYNGDGLEDIGKRFSLYNTPAFKRLNRSLLNRIEKSLPKTSDKKILRNYEKRNLNFVVWNDKDYAQIFDRKAVVDAFDKSNTTIRKMLGSRDPESGFDSISYISEDFKRLLELYYGVAARDGGDGTYVFKPIISSGGEDVLMFAKTVFVYDPDMQADVFSKNKNLDMLVSRSADKLKSSISLEEAKASGNKDRPVYINKSVDQMINSKDNELVPFMKQLKMKNVGVSTIPENVMSGSNSISLTNYMNNVEHAEFFNTWHKDDLTTLLGDISNASDNGKLGQMMSNSMMRRIALLRLKDKNLNMNIVDMQNSPEGLKNLGAHIRFAAMGADPTALGVQVLQNTIKSQFIDPLISPPIRSDFDKLGKGLRGGKFVLKQSMRFRDLKPTIREGEKDNTKITPGEVYLPFYAREGQFNLDDPDIKLKLLNEDGKYYDLEEKMVEVKKEIKNHNDEESADYRKTLKDLSDIGMLVDEIEKLNTEGLARLAKDKKFKFENLALGIGLTRYPRTAPNDLAVLRLKGFLGKDHGNTGIVNDFDVYNIFEGDYDVDEVDFQHSLSAGTWDHIQRVKHHWVNTKDVSFYEPPSQGLELLASGDNNERWETFDGNNRVFKKGIGVVQKTIRLVNHLANLGIKNTDKNSNTFGMNDLMRVKGKDGKEYTIAVDYDNASFFERNALEGQLIIDYWKGVSPDIVRDMPGYRGDYLFDFEGSIGKEDVDDLAQRLDNRKDTDGPHKSRIRIFRKFDSDGKEVALSDLDQTILKTLMKQHGDFLALQGNVYDNTGMSNKSTYQDIMDIGGNYFKHMRNLDNAVYNAAKYKHAKHEDFESYFESKSKVRAKSNKKRDYLKGDAFDRLDKEIKIERAEKPMSGTHTYQWMTRSPFLKRVLKKGEEVALINGKEGSVIERFYRVIVQKDPLGMAANNKAQMIPNGKLFEELESAKFMLLDQNARFGDIPNERLGEILPVLTKDINTDIKTLRYLGRVINSIQYSRNLTQAQKTKRIEALKVYLKEKQEVLKDYLPKEYMETGDIKYLKTLKTVKLDEEPEQIYATKVMMTLHEPSTLIRYNGDDKVGYDQSLREVRSMGGEEYGELFSGRKTNAHGKRTYMTDAIRQTKMNPLDDMKAIEDQIQDKLIEGYNHYGMAFLIDYAMPKSEETSIALFNNNPMVYSIRANSNFKRMIRTLFEIHDTATSKVAKTEIKESLELLAKRYNAYSNFFDNNNHLTPLKDQDLLSVINNAPGFSKKLTGTFDRYESLKIEKSIFEQDIFGMGGEYGHQASFFRNLMNDAFGKKTGNTVKEITDTFSYTHQLMMENDYMNPVSYYQMIENVASDLSKLGLDNPLTYGLSGGQTDKLSPHKFSPNMSLMSGGPGEGGLSIQPFSLLSTYRMNMLQKMIKQGKDIKRNQKKASESVEDDIRSDEQVGNCTPNLNT